jgi:hypothetical protein
MDVNGDQMIDVHNVKADTRCILLKIGLIISFDTTVSVMMIVGKIFKLPWRLSRI